MAQHDGVIDNGPGLAVRTDINALAQALLTQNSGPVEPTTKYPGMLWLDTTVSPDGVLRQRNQANTGWITPTTGVAGPAISNIVLSVKTTSGSYAKSADLKFLEVICIGGGGGSTNLAQAPAGNSNASGGGGAGGVSIQLYAASALAASEAYTVGTGGAAAGGAGGASTFKGQSAGGGSAGLGTGSGTTVTSALGGSGGAASGGQINQPGENGESGVRCVHGSAVIGYAGGGGGNMYGMRMPGVYTGAFVNGVVGTFPGGGSKGNCNCANNGATNAAAGGAGAIILREYF